MASKIKECNVAGRHFFRQRPKCVENRRTSRKPVRAPHLIRQDSQMLPWNALTAKPGHYQRDVVRRPIERQGCVQVLILADPNDDAPPAITRRFGRRCSDRHSWHQNEQSPPATRHVYDSGKETPSRSAGTDAVVSDCSARRSEE